ncbi:hypothetical protein [Marinobacterium arenosum]|uniref:hypothetical protein n=1 Tax=Marinobacterium arenosum TaxID=2862496 RepID=UPI001C9514B9|nr:hypothetical protein [Marinobacterium arenosum]MBY4675840.1 hypothetical protein [Marinobacterium arenosum]
MMKLVAKNDLVVEDDDRLKQWIVGLYDESGYNVCQVDMLAGEHAQRASGIQPQVLAHYHENLGSLEQEEICTRLCDAIEQAFNRHPEDLDHFHRVIEHDPEFAFEI